MNRCIQAYNEIQNEIKRLIIHIEPGSKNGMKSADKVEFRKILQSHLNRPYEVDLAVSLIFYTSRKNTPNLDKLVKNTLDLMHKEMIGYDQRSNIAFLDDSQIRYLSAANYNFPSKKGWIYIELMPHIKFRKMLELTDYANFQTHIIDRLYPTDGEIERPLKIYMEFENNRENVISVLGEKGFDSMQELTRLEYSQFFLGMMGLTLDEIISLHRVEFDSCKNAQAIGRQMQEMILISKINSIDAMAIPIYRGDTEKFRAEIKENIINYMNNYAFIFPLTLPVSVKIVYIPPIGHSKDLDNIVMEVCPLIVNKFCPPHSMKLDLKDFSYNEKERSTISKYEVIRLVPTDVYSQGGLKIFLGNAMEHENVFQQCQNIFEHLPKIST